MSKIEVNQISSQCGSTLTIGQSGDTVTLASGATQSGFGRTGTVDWCTTAKTSPFTAVSGKGYFVNTTCGAVTVTLPATPTAGDIISIKDYARTAGTNNITFCRNGSKIDGVCASGGITTDGESTTLIYVDGTKGWTSILDSTTNEYGAKFVTATGGTIITCGDYKTHIFTSDGCFSVSNAGNPAGSTTVDYLVVAGGGGAAGRYFSGGGGAGGFRVSNGYGLPAPTMSPLSACVASLPVSVQTYPVTVGGGGAGGSSSPTNNPVNAGSSGSNSVFSTITSNGGGAGGHENFVATAGGSGGGASAYANPNGAGNTPPVSPPQGNDGGITGAGPTCAAVAASSGGGGAGAAGSASRPGPGTGGIGSYIDNTFIGPTAPSYGEAGPVSSTRYLAAGGAGGGSNSAPNGPFVAGGIGGGGDGYGPANGPGSGGNGTTNTGSGGGGIGNNVPYSAGYCGGSGGSGIVMIRYKYQ